METSGHFVGAPALIITRLPSSQTLEAEVRGERYAINRSSLPMRLTCQPQIKEHNTCAQF